MKVAYQGIEGSYSESCAKQIYTDCETIPCKTFDDVFKKASEDEEVIAIIPARGRSKRIPGKNYKKFNGRPIIASTIRKLKESKIFDRIIVSTDSKKIANIFDKIVLFIVENIILPFGFKSFILLDIISPQLSRCSITSKRIITSYFFFKLRDDKFCLMYRIFKFDFIACFLATSIFLITKSTPVTLAPSLESGSQIRPPPHPKSRISKLKRGFFLFLILWRFIIFFLI